MSSGPDLLGGLRVGNVGGVNMPLHLWQLAHELGTQSELLHFCGVLEVEAMSVIGKGHGAAHSRVLHGGEVHVQHGPQRRQAVGMKEAVGRVAYQAGSVLRPAATKVHVWSTTYFLVWRPQPYVPNEAHLTVSLLFLRSFELRSQPSQKSSSQTE